MQDELANIAKVSRGEIGHLERGHRKPTLRTLRNLAAALGIDASMLLAQESGNTDEPPERPG
jgi:transcriptional regulator with XRE-family HTH domain